MLATGRTLDCQQGPHGSRPAHTLAVPSLEPVRLLVAHAATTRRASSRSHPSAVLTRTVVPRATPESPPGATVDVRCSSPGARAIASVDERRTGAHSVRAPGAAANVKCARAGINFRKNQRPARLFTGFGTIDAARVLFAGPFSRLRCSAATNCALATAYTRVIPMHPV